MPRVWPLAVFGFVIFCASISSATVNRSPVGTWQLTSGASNPGVTYITFNADGGLTGYGMSLSTFGLVTFSGNWTLDASGHVAGLYSESLNGETITGSFYGRTTNGKTLTGKVIDQSGTAIVTGVPIGAIPNMSGSWVAYATSEGVRVPEFITVSPSSQFPGVFTFTGDGSGPSGPFTVSGVGIVSSKGKVVTLGETDFAEGGTAITSSAGTFNLQTQTGTLVGVTSSGVRVRSRIVR